MDKKCQTILEELKSKSIISIGGTEAVSVAYAVAYARKRAVGALKQIRITVDSSIFKNGLNVNIPGCGERGLDFAAALGYVYGDLDKKLMLLSDYGPEDVLEAKKLLAHGKVSIRIKDDCDKLYIETILENEKNVVRVLVLDHHLNVISDEVADCMEKLTEYKKPPVLDFIKNENLGLEDFLEVVDTVNIEELSFIRDGLKYNLAFAEYEDEEGMADSFLRAMDRYGLPEDIITYTQNLCVRACEARIRGVSLPVMTAAGSANYGLAIYLAGYGVGSKLGVREDKILRAIALSNLMSLCVNSYVGSTSSVCDCGLAVGVGTAVGCVYLLDGECPTMVRAVKNMMGSVTGIICEGSRMSCAWKVGLSVSWAIKSALLAMEYEEIEEDGFWADNLDRLLENIAQIYRPLSHTINQRIVDIITGREKES